MSHRVTTVPAALAGLLVVLAAPEPAASHTWYVNPDGSGDATTIQAGLDLAAAGDVVEVACGSYPESLAMKSGVTLRGESAGCVILQGDYLRRLMRIEGADDQTRIENLIFINGLDEVGFFGRGLGGAVYCDASSPTFVDCSFDNCQAGYYLNAVYQAAGDGGAFYCHSSSVVFEDCDFQVNCAASTSHGNTGKGGAIFASGSSVTLVRCLVIDNRAAGQGGGICGHSSSLTIRDCYFDTNESIGPFDSGFGAAIFETGGSLELTDCTLRFNIAGSGGAVHASSAEVTGCLIEWNRVARDGGGMILGTGAVRNSTVRNNRHEALAGQGGGLLAGGGTVVESCLFTGNTNYSEGGAGVGGTWINCLVDGNLTTWDMSRGGGLYNPESVTGCTIVGNFAAIGAGVSGDVPIQSSLIAFNHGGEGVHGAATLTCCDLIGNEGGDWVGSIADQLGTNGNLEAFPLFCEPGVDYSLMVTSPCLPANNPCGVQIGAFGQGCVGPVSIEPETWARVKARFRD